MNYFSILDLNKEPFSNSPDPDFFFQSREHHECLQKLELSLHLKRGLNVVIGDVGTGKTTLCRQLIRRFSQREEIETHLILDPSFQDAFEFLATVAKVVSGKKPSAGTPEWQIKEFIKQTLFQKGVDQRTTIVLIIDEGQKIPAFCLELLREFLNYETNEFKLLQMVIFAQEEFEATVRKYPNFADRINLYHILKPLNFRDTRLMINYRLEKSSSSPHSSPLFTLAALLAIYRATGGYPRKIINLCHQCILAMIIQNRRRVTYFLVRKCARRVFHETRGRRLRMAAAAVGLAIAAAIALPWAAPERAARWVPEQWRAAIAWLAPAPESGIQPPRTEADSPKVPVETPAAAQLRPAELVETVPVRQKDSDTETTAGGATPEQASPAPAQEASPPPSSGEAAEEPAAGERPTANPPPAAASYPPTVGTLALARNETLSELIHNVYGEYNSRYFRSLILANPSIEDPDVVPVGLRIALPAVPAEVPASRKSVWWVKLAEGESLQSAYESLRRYPESAPPARLVCYWTPREGMRFALVLKQSFSDRGTAGLQLDLLPSALAKESTVISSWGGEDTVFFSNPYTNTHQ